MARRLRNLPSTCFRTAAIDKDGKSTFIFPSLSRILLSINDIRHSAVHRLPTTAKGILEMLGSAVRFAHVLGNDSAEQKIQTLIQEVESKVQALELHKNFLETEFEKNMQEIERLRQELDERERKAIETTRKEDEDHVHLVGSILEESVESIFNGDRNEVDLYSDAEHAVSYEINTTQQLSRTSWSSIIRFPDLTSILSSLWAGDNS